MTTNLGALTFELTDDQPPGTVNNFVNLVRSKFYDGIYFHRVVEDFVIQGGDPKTTSEAALAKESVGTGDPGYVFADDLPAVGTTYRLGNLVMADAGPNTNGSQYFIISGPIGVALPPQLHAVRKPQRRRDQPHRVGGNFRTRPAQPIGWSTFQASTYDIHCDH